MKTEPTTRNPNISITKLNLDEEIRKMGVADGLTSAAQLDVKVEETRKERYKNVIIAYHDGWNAGYKEALQSLGNVARWERLKTAIWILLGVFGLLYAIYTLASHVSISLK